MDYKVIVSPRAQHEIDNAIGYYALYSQNAAKNFLIEVDNAYKLLAHSPYFAVCYKNVRAFTLKRYPYSLLYVIDENNKTIQILACFHNKRHPKNMP